MPDRSKAPAAAPPGRHARHTVRALAAASAAALLMSATPAATAAAVQQALTFVSPTQTIWGAGGSAAFGSSGDLVGNSTFGVTYRAGASTGTVQSTVRGTLSADFDPTVGLDRASAVSVGFDFFGSPYTSRVQGSLGASIDVTAHINLPLGGINVGWNPKLLDRDYQLDIDKAFVAGLPQRVTGSDAFTPAAVGIGAPTFGIGLVGGAGVDLDIQQTASLRLDGLTGVVSARHRDTGTLVSRLLSITDAVGQMLDFDLDLAGLWDFGYSGLFVDNRYSTQFALNALPYVEYGVGAFCGDPGTDDDNVFCADDRKSTRVAGLDLFSSPTIELAYGALSFANAFSIEVLDQVGPIDPPPGGTVSEPGTLWMALAGGGLLLAGRRRAGRGPAGPA